MPNKKFVNDLIKGKIAETIFQQMFSEIGKFTVIPFGYENTIPELAQYHHLILPKVVGNFNNMPDFVLIKNDKSEAYLVEVKFRASINTQETIEICTELLKSWNPSHLFLATKTGFFYSPCNKILNNNGKLDPLSETLVNKDLQNSYLEILNEYIF